MEEGEVVVLNVESIGRASLLRQPSDKRWHISQEQRQRG